VSGGSSAAVDLAAAVASVPSGGALLRVHVQPGAKRSEIAGLAGDAVKVRIAAPPVDGKANGALLDFLAASLGVRKSAMTLARGAACRQKVVRVDGLAAAEVAARLSRASRGPRRSD
jgi:hypothetical protein